MKLRQNVALITGSAKRVGKVLALALAEQGCKVVVHYGHSAEAAQKTVNELKAHGVEAWAVSADLGDEAAVNSLVPFALGYLSFQREGLHFIQGKVSEETAG